GTGWEDLLNAVTALHDAEDSSQSKEYVAVVDSVASDGCAGGCIAGIGWVNQPAFVKRSAVSFAGFAGDRNAASPVMTHEMGHTFGRGHSPCGTTVGLQPGYPYPNARLGQWGYDNATGQLFDPNTHYDYMSYCNPNWTSDYTYHAIFSAWSWVSQPFGRLAPGDYTPAWVLGGSFDADGQWRVGQPHVETV